MTKISEQRRQEKITEAVEKGFIPFEEYIKDKNYDRKELARLKIVGTYNTKDFHRISYNQQDFYVNPKFIFIYDKSTADELFFKSFKRRYNFLDITIFKGKVYIANEVVHKNKETGRYCFKNNIDVTSYIYDEIKMYLETLSEKYKINL